MVLKFKKIYVNEKFKEDISNGVISYDLILDIFFSKKNINLFRYGFFGSCVLWFFWFILPIILIILSFAFNFVSFPPIVKKNLYPWMPIGFYLFYMFLMFIGFIYFKYVGDIEKSKKQYFLSFGNIFTFYIKLRMQIDDKRFKTDQTKILILKKRPIIQNFPKTYFLENTKPLLPEKYQSKKYVFKSTKVLSTDYISKTLSFLDTTQNIIYTNENFTNLKKKERWLSKKLFWKIFIFYSNYETRAALILMIWLVITIIGFMALVNWIFITLL